VDLTFNLFNYFLPNSKEYLSTRQILFIDQLTAVSAVHFDAVTTILEQTVQN